MEFIKSLLDFARLVIAQGFIPFISYAVAIAIVAIPILGVVFLYRKYRNLHPASPATSPERTILEQATNIAEQLAYDDRRMLTVKYDNIINTIRTALVMHEEGKGKVSAESILVILKIALLKLDGKALVLDTEEKIKAQKAVDAYSTVCNAYGFKTI
jgi:hypothetical protein